MKIYEVGGNIRDSLLGIKSSDTDFIVFEADENDLKKKFPGIKKVGSKKPVYIYKGREYTISPYKDIYSDLESRDLTINAVAKTDSGKIIMLPQTETDLEKKILRPVCEKNFFSDPLRVFRAARFASLFPDFIVSSELKKTMKTTAEKKLTQNISAERVSSEVKKAFSTKAPEKFIILLNETGNLSPWLREFENADKIPARPEKYHGTKSVLEHTLECMKQLYGNPLLVWMAFCHDIGKTATPHDLLPSHHGHENSGKNLAEKAGKRLKLSKRFINGGIAAAQYHMKAGTYNELKPSTRVKLLKDLYYRGYFREVFIITKADKGKNFLEEAEDDLKKILKVKLPEDKKNLGLKSGEILFQMECEAIKAKYESY